MNSFRILLARHGSGDSRLLLSLLSALLLVSAACGDEPPILLAQSPSPSTGDDAGADGDEDEREDDRDQDEAQDQDSCIGGRDEDLDEDGFTPAQGDCNDCSAQINPGALDVPGNEHDKDCDGTPATAATDCEGSLPLSPGSADDAARALGLCEFVKDGDKGWGVLSARFTTADGKGTLDSPLQVGVLPQFGAIQPLGGSRLLALSSGVARAPGQADYTASCDQFDGANGMMDCNCDLLDIVCQLGCAIGGLPPAGSKPPPGYPKTSSECPNLEGSPVSPEVLIYNQAALEVTLRVPSNAHGFRFDSAFFTSEFPGYVCSSVNDFFVVFMSPRAKGAPDDNILFDKNGEPVGLNSGLLAACDPAAQQLDAPRIFACEQGPSFLEGTGYGPNDNGCAQDARRLNAGASTGWLRTTTPVQPGQEIKLLFAVWDTGDAAMDSSVIVDNFTWLLDEVKETETLPILF